jgi:hypothetical protein
VGEEESRLIVIHLNVRCTATLALRLRVILRPVTGAMAVEASVVAVRLVFATGDSSLLSLLAATMVATLTLWFLLLAAMGTPTMLFGRIG